jgi:hypothetical protein
VSCPGEKRARAGRRYYALRSEFLPEGQNDLKLFGTVWIMRQKSRKYVHCAEQHTKSSIYSFLGTAAAAAAADNQTFFPGHGCEKKIWNMTGILNDHKNWGH